MTADYIVSENCTHCCASQDAHNELKLVLLMHGQGQLPASATSAASSYFLCTVSMGGAGGLVMMFRLKVGICLKTTTTSSQHVICPAACACSTLLLLHRGFKGAFTLWKSFYRVFSFCVLSCLYPHGCGNNLSCMFFFQQRALVHSLLLRELQLM